MQTLQSGLSFPEAFDRSGMFDQINNVTNAAINDVINQATCEESSPHSVTETQDRSLEAALMRTAVIIPARNEEDSIGLVMGDLPRVARVIVVNNGSTDSTAQIARDAGGFVVDEPVPGYGKACLAGLVAMEQFAAENETLDNVIEYVAFVDGDYSDHAHLLGTLLTPIVHDDADFVLGSRMLGKREPGAMPPQATWGNRLACFLMKMIWRTNYTDLGPFRVIRVSALRELDMRDENFGWTVEMQVKASVAGLRTLEIPVPYRRRVGISKISGTLSGTFKAGYKILYTIAKYAWTTRLSKRRD